ncbi:carboxymuconolactone decarboxylase family protein [Nocardia huaxiensis]|uniref:Carboxymuconolactone decarboxylase family protein n=2 Tax=Nocardia huaxiensis TaxID=2755382 RepID=A0A7D6VI76_9NOCA|nr:carboxymuconolactone decarboxylase family protein [Nocardia huaxiensis]
MEPRINMMATDFGGTIFKRLIGLGRTIQESPLPRSIQFLVQIRASQINGCGGCTDMHTKDAAAAGETAVRLNLIATWRDAIVFTDAERAALAFTEEGTRLADAHLGVSDETWEQARKHFDDDQLTALIAAVAVINAFNRLNVIARMPAGEYVAGMFDSLSV